MNIDEALEKLGQKISDDSKFLKDFLAELELKLNLDQNTLIGLWNAGEIEKLEKIFQDLLDPIILKQAQILKRVVEDLDSFCRELLNRIIIDQISKGIISKDSFSHPYNGQLSELSLSSKIAFLEEQLSSKFQTIKGNIKRMAIIILNQKNMIERVIVTREVALGQFLLDRIEGMCFEELEREFNKESINVRSIEFELSSIQSMVAEICKEWEGLSGQRFAGFFYPLNTIQMERFPIFNDFPVYLVKENEYKYGITLDYTPREGDQVTEVWYSTKEKKIKTREVVCSNGDLKQISPANTPNQSDIRFGLYVIFNGFRFFFRIELIKKYVQKSKIELTALTINPLNSGKCAQCNNELRDFSKCCANCGHWVFSKESLYYEEAIEINERKVVISSYFDFKIFNSLLAIRASFIEIFLVNNMQNFSYEKLKNHPGFPLDIKSVRKTYLNLLVNYCKVFLRANSELIGSGPTIYLDFIFTNFSDKNRGESFNTLGQLVEGSSINHGKMLISFERFVFSFTAGDIKFQLFDTFKHELMHFFDYDFNKIYNQFFETWNRGNKIDMLRFFLIKARSEALAIFSESVPKKVSRSFYSAEITVFYHYFEEYLKNSVTEFFRLVMQSIYSVTPFMAFTIAISEAKKKNVAGDILIVYSKFKMDTKNESKILLSNPSIMDNLKAKGEYLKYSSAEIKNITPVFLDNHFFLFYGIPDGIYKETRKKLLSMDEFDFLSEYFRACRNLELPPIAMVLSYNFLNLFEELTNSSKIVVCSDCQCENDLANNFCMKCGKKLKNIKDDKSNVSRGV